MRPLTPSQRFDLLLQLGCQPVRIAKRNQRGPHCLSIALRTAPTNNCPAGVCVATLRKITSLFINLTLCRLQRYHTAVLVGSPSATATAVSAPHRRILLVLYVHGSFVLTVAFALQRGKADMFAQCNARRKRNRSDNVYSLRLSSPEP